PPFLGTKVVKGISLDDIAQYINETQLFRGQWGFRPDKSLGEDDAAFKARMRPVLREKLEAAKAEGILVPQVVYGFFAANSDDDGPSLAGLFRQQYRGGRYSWGYSACPDLEDNARVADLLGADRIGVEASEDTGFMYHPEQTTSAIIAHHPQAKYFNAR